MQGGRTMSRRRRASLVAGIFLWVLLLAGIVAGQAAPAASPDYQQVRTEITALVEREMARTGTVGLSIVVIDDQRIVWAAGFGWADKAGKVPATPETVYQLASVSKLFTTAAAMQLAEEGKLDLDQPVGKYLPWFAFKTRYPDAGPITVRSIMTHHSGLSSDYFGIELGKPFTDVTRSVKDQYVCYPPNYIFSYSNYAFMFLGDVVETVGGKPYHALVRERLLAPLGMNSSFYENETGRVKAVAKGYEEGKERPSLPTIGIEPTAGLFSTTLDLAKFARMIFAGGASGPEQVLTKESLDEMFRAQNENVPLDVTYRVGLGWMLSDSAVQYAGKNVRHGGHVNNHAANITLLPDHKLGVVVLANSAEAFRMLGTVADETLRLMLAQTKGIKPPADRPKPSPAKVELPARTLAALTGYYATDLGVIRVTEAGGRLTAATSDFKLQLEPRENGLFAMQHSIFGLFPIRVFKEVHFSFAELGGRQVVLTHSDKGVLVIGEKAPAPFLSDAWRSMAGTYELANVNADATPIPKRLVCEIENERFLIKMANPMRDYPIIKTFSFLVQPLSEDEGIIVGLGQWKGDTVRRELADGVPRLLLAGLEYRRVGPAGGEKR